MWQVAREQRVTLDYVSRQIVWFEGHVPEIFADDWHDAERERRLEEKHEREEQISSAA